MKRAFKKISELFLIGCITLMTMPVLADLPKPPDKDIANGTSDWGDVGGAMVYRILSITCVALGAIILIAVAGSILKAYQTSHEKQDLGHFFKMLVVGVVCAALGMGLVYAGYSIIPSQK